MAFAWAKAVFFILGREKGGFGLFLQKSVCKFGQRKGSGLLLFIGARKPDPAR